MKDHNDELYSNKSNQMIQNYAWSLKEKQLKIMELLCSCYMTNYYDAKENTVTIGISDFMKELGSTTKGVSAKEYAIFRDSLKRLSDFSIIGIGFNGRERLIRMINTFEYLPDTSQIKCFMSDDYRESMKLQDRGNTKIEFRTICSMNSRFSIKLYNLLRSWQGKDEVYFDLDYLKELLNVTAKSYDNFAKFRQAVLDVAVDEINEKTNLQVSYTGLTPANGRGRKITRVVFNIKNNGAVKALPDTASESEASDLPGQANVPTDFELYLKDEIPEEVHKGEIERVRAINDIARRYIHTRFSDYLCLDDPDDDRSTLEKISEATRMANEDCNDRILSAVRTFTIREYNVRKKDIKTSHFAYFVAALEGWFSNNPNRW